MQFFSHSQFPVIQTLSQGDGSETVRDITEVRVQHRPQCCCSSFSQSSQPASQALWTRGSSTTAIPPRSLQTCLIPPRLLPSCIYIKLYLSPTIAQFSLFIYLPVDSFYNLSLDSHRARDRTSCCGMHWMPTSLVECASVLMQWKGPFVNMPCDQRADACSYFQY